MPTYSELMSQAQALMAQAEDARKQELAQVVSEIKALMQKHGITAADLGVGGGKSAGKKSKGGAKEAKYRGPNGELWAGGPGRKPQWVRDAVAAGKDIESYRI